jgi:hypothetical protein
MEVMKMMNVNNCLVKSYPFDALNIGDTFILQIGSYIYLKISEVISQSDGLVANAICLNDCRFYHFDATEWVNEVNCTLNVDKWEV